MKRKAAWLLVVIPFIVGICMLIPQSHSLEKSSRAIIHENEMLHE